MQYFKIQPETPDEIALYKDCDLPFARMDCEVILVDPIILESTQAIQAILDEADPQPKSVRPQR